MGKYQFIIDKIREIYHKPEGKIYLHEPKFIGHEKEYLLECIDSSYVSSVGKFVDRFEEMVAEFTGAKKTVVCVNGTNALHIGMLLLGVERDDEVITQPLTFIATCNAISYIGAHPVFVDVDIDTLGMSPESLRRWLEKNAEFKSHSVPFNKTTGRRIKACVPMHTFGHPCKIDEIIEICQEFNIEVIEDAAESIGSFYKGKHTGTFGKIGALSFNGNKTITTGGGGMLLFQDEELGKYAKHLTTQARVPHQWEFAHDHIGYNYRMPNINAAIGCAQMEQLPHFLAAKRKVAEQYEEFFSTSASISAKTVTFIKEPRHAISNYWLNALIFEDLNERDEFLKETNENGILTRPTWQLMNKLTMFNHCQSDELPNSEWLEERVVQIPSSVI